MLSRDQLEHLYGLYNRRCYIDPDPLLFLHRYPAVEDREIAGLVASGLAFGRVRSICASVERALALMGPSPRAFLDKTEPAALRELFAGFRHRYVHGGHLADLLAGIRRLLREHGGLERAFEAGLRPEHATVLPALAHFADRLGCPDNPLVPSPAKGGACKRFHLYLRWMIRRDEVDPGGWNHIPPRLLVVPLDVHMARLSRRFRLTRRKTADAAMALEVTAWFRRRRPEDPVRYDFTLTRFGIRSDLKGALPRPARHAKGA